MPPAPTAPLDPELTPSGGTAAAGAVDAMKIYGIGDAQVRALDGVTVSFETGKFTAIMGPSGSGKSTLLHCLAGLDDADLGCHVHRRHLSGVAERQGTHRAAPHQGRLHLPGVQPHPDAHRRREHPPADDARRRIGRHRNGSTRWSTTVGLEDRLKHRPSELSGGQQQRVAVARALASKPQIIFADEPTGNLDSTTGHEILAFMQRAVREFGQTIVMVTHDPTAASYADRVVFVGDGKIVGEMVEPTADSVLDRLKQFGE